MKENGDKFEKEVSLYFHASYTPILISSKVLRHRSMGQVDVAFEKKGRVYIAECKSGKSRVGRWQLLRLQQASQFIGLILGRRVELIAIQQVAKLNDAEYPFRVCNIRELM